MINESDNKVVVLFPGQGSRANDMRDWIDDWCPELGETMLRILKEDPFSQVGNSTAFAQPVIYCVNLAGWRAITQVFEPVAVAGHSLGEFAALAAAGVLDPYDALELVALRGRLMQDAQKRQSGGMIAVSGSDLESLPSIAERCGVTIANENSPSQVVLSGPSASIEVALEQVTAAGLRAARLPVCGAFHSPLMAEVGEAFGDALARVEVRSPELLALCTTTCAPFTDVKQELTRGITRPVLWRQSLEHLCRAGFRRFVEAGPGTVLGKLAKQTCGDLVDVLSMNDVG